LLAARDLLAGYPGSPTVQLFSALAGQGVEVLAGVLDGWLERGQKKPDHLGG
jgi:hypothetical protein